ncbi:reverse transcriptase [Cucumis melo var. makuwa]|uniref:Reverse transcriptase n=1 Tax=Cucumis melo var. makuwa TaxID=1194695 RepID=A0A5A7T542_CUCMM|nr:reverse transcriptase [Cucumis melo var. makuwa]TYK03329.1 reverse transcriptase [Cucumis melo var. makuwa]
MKFKNVGNPIKIIMNFPQDFKIAIKIPNVRSPTNDEHQERRFRPHYDERRREPAEYKMKIDLPSYDGKRNIETFLDWIKNVENFFNHMNTPERKKVHLVALKLKA